MEVDIPMLNLSDSDEEEIHSFIRHDDEFMETDDQVGGVEDLEPSVKAKMLEAEYKVQHSRYIAQKSFYGDDDEVSDEQKVAYQLIDGQGDDDKDFFDDNWDKIRTNTISILQTGKLFEPHVGQEEIRFLTFAVCDIVNNGQSDSLTSRLRGVMEEYIPKIFDQTVEGENSEDLIDRVYNNWTDFKRKLDILSYLYMYLNGRVGQRGSRPIWPMGISCLIKLFEDKFHLLDKIAEKLIGLIDHERRTTEIDLIKVKSLVVMFSNLRQYDSIFEPRFILATSEFYSIEAASKFEEVDLPGYIAYANMRIAEEANRVERYLNSSSKQKLYRTVHSKIVDELCDQMIIKGADALFEGNNIADLRSFYDLLRDCKDGHNHLKNAFANYIKKVGKARVLDEKQDKTLVEDLLQMKEKLDNLIVQCFDHNDKFVQAEKDAFAYFVNTRPSKPAELIAKYMDSKMRAANKSYNDVDFDKLMDRVILLFRFIQGKDVFEAFYKRDLAKRLLCGKSASVDAEKAMLSKLRSECGPGFTSKLEGMFRDMEVSKDTLQAFKTHVEKNNSLASAAEFSVNVLTMGSWPTYDTMEVTIPPQLDELQAAFKDFYLTKNKGRQLNWQYNLASASMNSKFKNGTKELEVSMFQAFVLLLFNAQDQYTFKEIQDATKIENNELIRTMISLTASKTPILKRTKAEKQKIMPDEVFSFNDDFTDKMHKIKISQVQMKETEREQQQTEEEVEQDRLYVIDANIVRIMKQHKNLNHTALINELFTVLRFPARNQDVKKRIESLIEREYVARDDHDQQVYRYVA
uniref:Cullin family profile domain-containing protein n=1 Tax=Panagrolaimus sp. ES5 TaxID=591445 RepID=A0AC34FG36_9BILA